MPWEETDEHIRSGHRDPDRYDEMKTIVISEKEGIMAVYGHVKGSEDTWEVQSYLFSKEKGWTMEKAKEWFSEHEDENALNHVELAYGGFEPVVGERFTTAPVTLTRTGVMNGLYKPPEAIRALADEPLVAIPVVFDHPPSADPEITDVEEVIGLVTSLEVGESSVDGEPALQGMLHLLNIPETAEHRAKMRSKTPLEVSIGYWRKVEEGKGVWNEQAYDGVETLVIPYHLGLMKATRAACPVDMGCGVGVTSEGGHSMEGDYRTGPEGEVYSMDEDEMKQHVAALSLTALAAMNAGVCDLAKERDGLREENEEIAARVEELVTKNAELEKVAEELASIKAEARTARLNALIERMGENAIPLEELEDATDKEISRLERLFPEAEDEGEGVFNSVRASGSKPKPREPTEGVEIGAEADRYFGQPMGAHKEA